ncbi:Dioxygenase [Pigmentiphaga humi]|uniref:Dioxygenase n=1 Tax=Pigmentiphaga humi TaxID=2478468 RepID=A0A3P4B5H3_9BURK|nr:3,4-dioxygenase subunit beta [Pigmentiphaga humi]VCU71302.1 Dioxygenase [Pigmentiphaga humi]
MDDRPLAARCACPSHKIAPSARLAEPARHGRRLALARLMGMGGAMLGLPAYAAAPLACRALREEAAGPYTANGTPPANAFGPLGAKADGRASNAAVEIPPEPGLPAGYAPNALALPGIVRSDLRHSVSPGTGTAEGVPLRLTLTLVDASRGCAALPDHSVYLWHCTREGGYSLYTEEIRQENFLRGVQAANDAGEVTFETIFPGCHPGRYPHLHVEIYAGTAQPLQTERKLLTSQLALPEDACGAVYGEAGGYERSLEAYARTSLARDGIFGKNTAAERAAQTIPLRGNPRDGYVGKLLLGLLP